MFALDYKTKVPIYEQIQDQVISFIALGIFKPNEQLPAVRQLASDLGVNPNTVAKAYQELERLGYIVSQTGRGSFISDTSNIIDMLKSEYIEQLKSLLRKMKTLNIPHQDIILVTNSIFKKERQQ